VSPVNLVTAIRDALHAEMAADDRIVLLGEDVGTRGGVFKVSQGFLEDFASMLKRLVPSETYYAHDDWDRRTENICPEDMDFGNGHSHCMAMLLGTAGESIPVRDGELCLGTWQRVLFLELDRERDRRWIVQVVGT